MTTLSRVLRFTLLDGPVGSELTLRGAPTAGPTWSAQAVVESPQLVREIHEAYADAGVDVHTACTFRTQPLHHPQDFAALTARAVSLAREAARGARVAGSLAPVGDCYAREPSAPRAQLRALHAQMARALEEAGVDLVLCETFPSAGEAEIAVEVARETGLPVWIALTAGPRADLMTPDALAEGAARCLDRGAEAVLVSCVAAEATLPYVQALARLGAPFGAYANAGLGEVYGDGGDEAVARYVACARTWLDAGATILGACCGTRPSHARALAGLR